MRRRDFIALIGGAMLARPQPIGAQQPTPVRRLGVLMSLSARDRDSQERLAVFFRELETLGWTTDRNLRIDVRWGEDSVERTRAEVTDLIGLGPDVIFASGNTAASPLHRATRSVPIVFVQVAEPIGEGLIEGFARPGGNITGFASIEYGVSAKWIELLKEVAPAVTRVLVVRDPGTAAGKGQFGAIERAASALGVAVSPVGVRDGDDIERAITTLAQTPNGGLIVTTSTRASAHRELILALTARHRLPAAYPFRFYAAAGGLISYGVDWNDQYRRAAGYVDRILKGEKPAGMAAQTPAKYDLSINRKTARALGLDVPPTLLARADAVLE